MERELIEKYFQDQCTEEELVQVLDWFQTDEGQEFLERDIKRQNRQLNHSNDYKYSQIDSERIFTHIQLDKKNECRNRGLYMRVASIALVVGLVSSILYWSNIAYPTGPDQKQPAFRSYVTQAGQQKNLTLSDGTKIRLNERSKLTIPMISSHKNRIATLKGEAYFEVAHNSTHPFVVSTNGSKIRVLGTKFNVRVDTAAGNVQVAVVQGKVALKKKGSGNEAGALLTANHFGILRLSDDQITIENANVQNYTSWINKRLIFNGQSLGQISRQLERLYNVQIRFEKAKLKNLNLTANFEKTNTRSVLKVISTTLNINFRKNGKQVVWLD